MPFEYVSLERVELEFSNNSPVVACNCCTVKGATFDTGPHNVAPLGTLVTAIAFRDISIAKRCGEPSQLRTYDQEVLIQTLPLLIR